MAERDSLQYSSETGDEYDYSGSTSFPCEASEEVCLSGPSLGMEVLPYRFEPPDLSPADSQLRLHSSSEIEIGHCKVMTMQRESVCCNELEQIKGLLEDSILEVHPTCITQHTDFNNVCLCRSVLTVYLYTH